MTIEEAIELLNQSLGWCQRCIDEWASCGLEDEDHKHSAEAYQMAISALRAQQKTKSHKDAEICGTTGAECCRCNPGPCENRKEADKPLTNADHIRAMTDEELAEIIMCPHDMNTWPFTCVKKPRGAKNCTMCVLDWLKQPYDGGVDIGK
jgi:hypothetical protein